MKVGFVSVLIVEDEIIVAEDLAGRLRQLGYEIAGIAASGEEAVELTDRLRPQLIIMDIQLNGTLDGIEAADRILARHDLPVVYLTAHADAATLVRAKVTGPSGYILKPYGERELAIQIEMALYKHAADQKLRESNEELREYAYALTHSLKAPFRAIRNYANFLSEDLSEKLEPEQQRFLCGIKQASLANHPCGRLEVPRQLISTLIFLKQR